MHSEMANLKKAELEGQFQSQYPRCNRFLLTVEKSISNPKTQMQCY